MTAPADAAFYLRHRLPAALSQPIVVQKDRSGNEFAERIGSDGGWAAAAFAIRATALEV